MPLNETASSPWHLTFDHRTPRDEDDIVVCAALFNDMKTDLDEAEFKRIVAELAEVFAGTRSSVSANALGHWKRA